jgi:ABC-type Mn2+/Zn2+ transport system permease subunit
LTKKSEGEGCRAVVQRRRADAAGIDLEHASLLGIQVVTLKVEGVVNPERGGFYSTIIWTGGKVAAMKNRKETSILWIEGIGFSLLIALCWVTELVRIPHLILGEAFTPNWRRALLRSVVIILVWLWVHVATRRLLARLHYLEKFLRICGWCRKVCHDGEWLEVEKFFSSRFATTASHGICPDCLKKSVGEIAAAKNRPPEPPQ